MPDRMPDETPPVLPSFRSWLDRRATAGSERDFLEFRGRRWSYADLARVTDAVAAALHARGVAPGDRVAITLPNSPEHLFAWLGAAKLGATVAPLHAQWTPAEIARALAQLRPRLVIGSVPDFQEQLETKNAGKETDTETRTFIEGNDRNEEAEAFVEGNSNDGEAKTSIEGKDRDKEAEASIEGKGPDGGARRAVLARALSPEAAASPALEARSPSPSPLLSPLPATDAGPSLSPPLPLPLPVPSMEAVPSLPVPVPVPSSFPSMEAVQSLPVPVPSSFPSMEVFASSSSAAAAAAAAAAAQKAAAPTAPASIPLLTREELRLLIEKGNEPFPDVPETAESAPAELLFTSGTTGLPKAAVQSFRSMMLTGEAFADWLRLGPDDRLFTCLPLAHVNARFYSTMGALAAGATLVLEEKFSASAFWRWMAESGATVVNTIGAMLRILLQAPPSEAERAHRLRVVYTSPALGEELHRAFEERFGVRLVVGYGMTECTFGFIHPLDPPLESEERHLASMGRPRRHPDPRWPVGWRLVDPASGQDVPLDAGPDGFGRPSASSDASGEIWLSGPTLFSGYFENDAATASVMAPDGWLRTGDLAARDTAGFWTFVGRTKEMIRRRGENVSPLEIEELLMGHPAVAEAAVLGVPSALGEEEIAAFVVAKPGASVDVETLHAHCAARLAKFKIPSEWHLLDVLPRTSTNRVAKAELRRARDGSASS